jgi:branched-chain amino acid aminotransferase
MKKQNEFICFNGKIISSNDFKISGSDRAFQYGDGIFETMHWHQNKILFIDDHFERLKKGLLALKIIMPASFSKKSLAKIVTILINKNKITGDARVRLQVWRKEGGFYIPVSNEGQFIITVNQLMDDGFSFPKKGLTIGLCENVILPLHNFQNLKTCNSIPYVLAGIYAKENNLDDCLIMNSKGKIAEATSSNVFMVKDGKVFTPPLTDGCVEGVMRKQVIQLLQRIKIPFKEKSLTPVDFENANEIFLTNVIYGIRWVESYNGAKMKNKFSSTIFSEAQKSLKF